MPGCQLSMHLLPLNSKFTLNCPFYDNEGKLENSPFSVGTLFFVSRVCWTGTRGGREFSSYFSRQNPAIISVSMARCSASSSTLGFVAVFQFSTSCEWLPFTLTWVALQQSADLLEFSHESLLLLHPQAVSQEDLRFSSLTW